MFLPHISHCFYICISKLQNQTPKVGPFKAIFTSFMVAMDKDCERQSWAKRIKVICPPWRSHRLLVLGICHLLFEKARERRWRVSSDYKIGWGHIDRGGGPEESEGGTYAILIVPNRLLSHRHLHHMGRNYPLSMDGASYHRTVAAKTLPLYQLCNRVGQNTERWRLLRYCLHICSWSIITGLSFDNKIMSLIWNTPKKHSQLLNGM